MLGHREQEECRHSCNVMLLKIEMEFHSYFVGFAQITWKKPHKVQSRVPHASYAIQSYMSHIHSMSGLSV